MLAQSVSRSSWLRMYQVISIADTFKCGEVIFDTVDSSREIDCSSCQPARTISGSSNCGSSHGMNMPRRKRYAPPKLPPYSSRPAYFGEVKRRKIAAETRRNPRPAEGKACKGAKALTTRGSSRKLG